MTVLNSIPFKGASQAFRPRRSDWIAVAAGIFAIASVATIATAQMLPGPPEEQEATAPNVAAPAAAEFDLDLGLGMQGTLQDYADQWMAERANEGLRYNVAVGMADVLGEPGQSGYIESFDLSLQKAILKAHSQFISEIVANDVNHEMRSFSNEKRGFDEAKVEKACMDRPAARLSAKLAEAANAVANKMISQLGGQVDPNTDLDRSIHCVANTLTEAMGRSTEVARQRAIRGARVLRVQTEGKKVGVAVAYGNAGIELADAIKTQKAAASSLPTARAEIGAWVDKNMLSHREILDLIGIRSFKLSNGEWAVVSLGIAGIPRGFGNMSETEMRIRATNAFPRSDINAMGQLQNFAGASVKSFESNEDNVDYVKSFETEIKDGVMTASVEPLKIEGAMAYEINSIAKGQLRGVVTVKTGARASVVGGNNVVYTVRAWSPSLYANARAMDSALSGKPRAASSGGPSEGAATNTASQSPDMKEDW